MPNALTLEVLLHYFISPEPVARSQTPATQSALAFLRHHEMIDFDNVPAAQDRFVVTAKGRVFVEHLLSIPLPVARWVMPDATRS